MNHQTLLLHTLIRDGYVDSPESARRREHLLRLEQEAREARRRRRRQRVHRGWNALLASHRTVGDGRMRRVEAKAPDLRKALR